jgi:hypothetical protein
MKIYQLKITLEGIKPPVWRKFQITEDTTLDDLHYIIQAVMGWQNAHLHQFMINKEYYSPDMKDIFGMEDEPETKNTAQYTLARLEAPLKGRFAYIYDFGDSWEHTLLIEKIEEADPAITYPVCLSGKRACPPEDCGGVWGYTDLLETLAKKKGSEYKEMKTWMDGMGYKNFDPEAFSVETVNKLLHN